MAIIDNYISKNEVANLIGKDITVIDAHGNSIKEYKWAEMTHGTVCASILAEKFEDANVTAVSLGDSHMEISLEEVCSAFQLFEKSNFKCICLSIGIHNWIHLHALYNITQRIVSDGIQIISSGSNDEKITFPAAYPWVLGVKYMPYISGIKRIYKSEDGCDIATGFFKSQVLEKLSIRNSFFMTRTSSMAVPYVASELYKYNFNVRILDYLKESKLKDEGKNRFMSFKNPLIYLYGACNIYKQLISLFVQNEYEIVFMSDYTKTDISSMQFHINGVNSINNLIPYVGIADAIIIDSINIIENLARFVDVFIYVGDNTPEEIYNKIFELFA